MAWTTPRTWTTGELVTAAFMNTHVRDNLDFLKGVQVASDIGAGRTFTNTGYLDLDALTGGAGTLAAVAVTVDTDVAAVVHMSAHVANSTAASSTLLSYRISGATTLASNDDWALGLFAAVNAQWIQAGSTTTQEGLTAGSNTFELQVKVSANTGTLIRPYLAVQPI